LHLNIIFTNKIDLKQQDRFYCEVARLSQCKGLSSDEKYAEGKYVTYFPFRKGMYKRDALYASIDAR
jgi:hypothetical protein